MNDSYHYTESGLDNVFVEGVIVAQDNEGETCVTIPNVGRVHAAIAAAILEKRSAMNGKELRFLRTEMGMTQAELGALLQREPLTLGRWERGEHAMEPMADALVRLLARERLGLDVELTAEAAARRTIASATETQIRIDGRDLENDRVVKDAA